jgi:outer membrane protein OmpA-like peptidoglycan-associated protein
MKGEDIECKNKFMEMSKGGGSGWKNGQCDSQHKVYFEFNNHCRLNENDMETIKVFVAMAKNNNEKILVVGHADKVGSESYNKMLSMKRARMVADKLVMHGISKDRIKLIAAGEKWAGSDDAASRNASLYFANDETMKCFHQATGGNNSCGMKMKKAKNMKKTAHKPAKKQGCHAKTNGATKKSSTKKDMGEKKEMPMEKKVANETKTATATK